MNSFKKEKLKALRVAYLNLFLTRNTEVYMNRNLLKSVFNVTKKRHVQLILI